MSSIVNVKGDCGAAGDGSRDDTASIQAAFDIVDVGGTVIIPFGAYKISRNASNYTYTNGTGNSYSALKITKPMTVIFENNPVLFTQTLDSANAYGILWIYRTTEVHIKGGSFIGDTFPLDGLMASRAAILIQESDHCSVEGTYTRNYSQGINLYKSDYCTVDRVFTEYNKYSGIISNLASFNKILNCTVINSHDGHISLYGGAVGSGNLVEGCTVIENRPDQGGKQGITIENEKRSIARNNRLSGFYYSIDVKNGADSCVVEANEMRGFVFGVAIRDGDDGSGNTKLQSNNILVENNTALYPKLEADGTAVWPHRAIYVHSKAGTNHIIRENVTKPRRIVYAATEILGNDEIYGVKFIDNYYVA